VIAELYAFADDRYIVSALLFIGSVAFFIWVAAGEYPGLFDSFTWKELLVKWLPTYLGAGIGVAFVKWLFYVRKKGKKLQESIADLKLHALKSKTNSTAIFDADGNITNYLKLNMDLPRNPFNSSIKVHDRESFIDAWTPRATSEADRITFWIIQWPLVAVATVFEDLILNIGKWVAEIFETIFSKLSKTIVANYVK